MKRTLPDFTFEQEVQVNLVTMWPLGITPVFSSRQKGVKILMMMMMVRQNCAGVNLITVYFTL